MKKFTSVFLCIALAFSLCACGDSPAGTPDTPDNPSKTTAVGRGAIVDGKYENKSLGIGWAFDESWYLADDDEIAEIMGYTKDALSDTDFAENIDSGKTICDLYAQDEYYSTLNLQVQKFDSFFSRTMTAKMSDQQLIDEVYKEFADGGYAQIIYDSLGLSDGMLEKGITTFGDTERPCIRISGVFETEDGDIPFFETMVYVVSGKYMGTLTAATYFEDYTDEIFAEFYFL